MAWTVKNSPVNSGMAVYEEVVTLGNASQVFSSDVPLDAMCFPNNQPNRRILVTFQASAVDGTNLDIAVYGKTHEGATSTQLLDAVVADVTGTGIVSAIFDLNAYPASLYSFGITSDADETANTITIVVSIPRS